MQSSEHQDIPAAWTDTHDGVKFLLSAVGLSAISAFSFLFGIMVAAAGNVIALKYFLLFALFTALIVTFALVGRYRRVHLSSAIRTIERDGVPGTEIRYSGWQFTILVALMGCGTLLCATAAIETFIYQDEGFPGFAVVIGALGIVFASFIAVVVSGRVRRGGVTLTSQGIIQRGRSFESRLDWSSLVSFRAVTDGYPIILAIAYANADWNHRYTTRFWRIDRLPPAPMIEFDCRQFDVDPYILYSYVRTYVENPALRAELGTEAALTRAQYLQLAR
ncbi:hypothetical protein M2272_001825 [Mycobacterium frederiksbergense]|uniref:PH domain-containing protein n=1 Tax=Mycolicibacterium frederiksbergense TaxID=117567 RepID=A0ABT6KY54_9MYCO|nr:hypothetical protein [Mycolicibacterium frederiksbergense]MDH6195196.1 hypothetical protein [Mycolicibacterium frederiksbergense]